ncbi:EamA family transporter [Melaminivora jejuensis]|uniref:DMT family transporter n=1 Tax=Melaminivora jejuensis TaxID=1267217 RepID=UPI001ADF3088|nr:DMT family transporter [Melaminivora jejuensis]UHJ64089.1 DMT family transporter [Melaminivora jejuensis]
MSATFSSLLPGLWVPVVLFAALAQTARNAAQRSLTAEVGTLAATLVRFLFGLPFAAAWLIALYALPGGQPALAFSWAWAGWIALGAFFQVMATAALLLAMQERNFAVAVTLSKTEVLQVALFAGVLLHELPSALAGVAMVVATVGVLLLSLPPRRLRAAAVGATGDGGGSGRAALYGLACGACFAVSSVGFRGAALALGEAPPWLSGAWGVLLAQSLQSLGLGGWIVWRAPAGLAPLARAWRVSLLAGSMGAAASLAWFTAYAMQGAAQIRTLGMVEVVFSYLVSRRLGESFSTLERLGLALMLIGLVLVCLQGV